MNRTAPVIEIFSSIQGEGTHAGEHHLFVRFQDCALSCQFCDTPASFVHNPFCRVEEIPFSKKFSRHPNPLTVSQLNQLLAPFGEEQALAVTGGEPLQQVTFLQNWLPTIHRRYPILLETAGIHYRELEAVIDLVDIVGMDLKLPSVTGMHPYWNEHREFLTRSLRKETYVKVIVSSETAGEDLREAIDLVATIDPQIPFLLQPAQAFGKFRAVPLSAQLNEWSGWARQRLASVQIAPQLHKQWGVL